MISVIAEGLGRGWWNDMMDYLWSCEIGLRLNVIVPKVVWYDTIRKI